MVLRDPYAGLGHQFSVVFGLVWFKQRKLFTLGCTYTGSALPYSNLSWFSTGGGVSLLVFLHQCGQADTFSLVGRRAHALLRGQ